MAESLSERMKRSIIDTAIGVGIAAVILGILVLGTWLIG